MKNKDGNNEKGDLKRSLRASIQRHRGGLSRPLRQQKSRLICSRFTELKCYRDSVRILAYYPFRSEIDTTIIIEDALSRGKKVVLPRVAGIGLELYYIKDPGRDLQPGSYDIMEPIPGKCPPARPGEIELAIVPGVGFDHDLNRLGYGGGFYDRLLANLPRNTPRIALAFDMQIVETVPVSGHDLKVDMILTETTTIKKESSSI